MAKSGNASSRKPRKKRQSINFLTPREKSKSKGTVNDGLSTTPGNGDEGLHSGSDKALASDSKRIKSVSSKRNSSRAGQRDNSTSENVLKMPLARKKNKTVESGNAAHTTGNDNNDFTFKSSRKPAASDKAEKKVETKASTQTKKRKRPSVNFVAHQDRRRISPHHQSITGHTLKRGDNVDSNARAFDSSVSSINGLSDTPVNKLSDSCFDSQSIEHSTSAPVPCKTSQKRKSADVTELQATPGRETKKRKTWKNTSPANSSFTSRSSSAKGRSKSRKSSAIHTALDRIRDLKVTKKSFEMWKPLSKVTIGFVEDILKSVTLNVIAEANLETDESAGRCLAMLKKRVTERLPTLKAPCTKGDYRKMEAENRSSEDAYLERSRELNVLNKRIKEEQRLLDTQTEMVVNFTKQLEKYEHELEILERDKAHPLITQSKDVMNLPRLPDDFFIEDEMSDEIKSLETRNLCETLLDLRQNNKAAELGKWMEKLTDFAKELHQ